jgi:hypothetical protein
MIEVNTTCGSCDEAQKIARLAVTGGKAAFTMT